MAKSEGGSFASVTLSTQGKGLKIALDTAETTISISIQGTGAKYTQGSAEAGVSTTTQADGIAIKQDYSEVVATTVTAQGEGTKIARAPPVVATINIVIEGIGTKYTQGESESVVTVELQGTGQKQRWGESQTSVYITTSSEGLAIFNGASETTIAVTVESIGMKCTTGANETAIVISTEGWGLASAFVFWISKEGVLEPLNVFITGDSRKELLPAVREYSEQMPGRHGDIQFATKLEPRILELHVATDEGLTPAEREQLKRTLAAHLNPVAGYKSLIFADDINKTYMVKYAGHIPLEQMASSFNFVIPFKLGKPYIIETFMQSLTGNGNITNVGTVEAFLTIEIHGAASGTTTITVGDSTLTYTEDIAVGETVVVDTEKWTVKKDGVNAVDNYAGGFPKLAVGDTAVTAGSNVVFKWQGRWV